MSDAKLELNRKRLLIVDDNETNRRILTLMAQSWGMSPRSTGSPLEALQLMSEQEAFDLAIVDMNMPEMDGVELASRLRALGVKGQLPLILLSSLVPLDAVAKETAQKVGFAALLPKPIKASALLNAIMGVFLGKPVRVSRPDQPGTKELDNQMSTRLPLRILLVDDNPTNLKLGQMVLKRLGYTPDLAGNGLEALRAVGSSLYDVVLMDVEMPEMDGLEATKAMHRTLPKDAWPYVVAVTANALVGDSERCLQAGMDAYLSKPLRVNELIACLEVAGRQRGGVDAQ